MTWAIAGILDGILNCLLLITLEFTIHLNMESGSFNETSFLRKIEKTAHLSG
jgi:hypothetical protein